MHVLYIDRVRGWGISPAHSGPVMPLSRKNTKKALPFCAGLQNMEKRLIFTRFRVILYTVTEKGRFE